MDEKLDEEQDEKRPSLLPTGLDCGDRPRDRRNKMVFTGLLVVWALTFLAATFLAKTDRVPAGVAQWATVLVPAAIAVLAVLAYARYLRDADELHRSIELHAIVIAVGVGFVVWPSCQILERLGVPLGGWSDAPLLAMCIAYPLGVLIGRRRYQ